MAESTPVRDNDSSESSIQGVGKKKEKNIGASHREFVAETQSTQHGFKVSRAGGGDTAMALFDNPEDIHEPYDTAEEKRLVRKIDWMILPYLAVCYAFL